MGILAGRIALEHARQKDLIGSHQSLGIASHVDGTPCLAEREIRSGLPGRTNATMVVH